MNEQSVQSLLRVFLLDLAMMAVLFLIAGAVLAAGIELPETALANVELTLWLIGFVIIGAPIIEELAFRSWLSGRPGHVLAVLFIGSGLGAAVYLAQPDSLLAVLYATVGISGGIVALFVFRGESVMGWFAAAFPLFFWFSTVGFALIHLQNFSEGEAWQLLPLVLPQFLLGGLLGYVRVQNGLWAAIALHAMHNATLIGLVALATMMG